MAAGKIIESQPKYRGGFRMGMLELAYDNLSLSGVLLGN